MEMERDEEEEEEEDGSLDDVHEEAKCRGAGRRRPTARFPKGDELGNGDMKHTEGIEGVQIRWPKFERFSSRTDTKRYEPGKGDSGPNQRSRRDM